MTPPQPLLNASCSTTSTSFPLPNLTHHQLPNKAEGMGSEREEAAFCREGPDGEWSGDEGPALPANREKRGDLRGAASSRRCARFVGRVATIRQRPCAERPFVSSADLLREIRRNPTASEHSSRSIKSSSEIGVLRADRIECSWYTRSNLSMSEGAARGGARILPVNADYWCERVEIAGDHSRGKGYMGRPTLLANDLSVKGLAAKGRQGRRVRARAKEWATLSRMTSR